MAKYKKVFSIACYCPNCGEKGRVYNTRPDEDPVGLVRSRRCWNCGKRWRTVELFYNEFKEWQESEL